MKKIIWALFISAFVGVNLFAYDPPAGGQNYLRLTEPQLITGANSSAGGGIFEITPASIVNNPALTAWEQRITLDVAGTLFINTNGDDSQKMGSAFEGGFLFPSRWCVSSLLFQGVWTEFSDMPVGNTINFSAGFSKDITDQVSVGLSGNFGMSYGTIGSDWTASAAVGAYYNYGDLFFVKDLRFGVSTTNIGKVFADTETMGIKGEEADEWPGLCTVKTGVAASFVKTSDFELGSSVDFSFPAFQDFVIDAGLQIQIKDFLKISSSWEMDVVEFAEEAKNILPSVGVSFKFRFNAKEGSYLSKKGWEQSDMRVSGAWKQMYESVNAVSAGLIMNLGLKDTKAPEVILWEDE